MFYLVHARIHKSFVNHTHTHIHSLTQVRSQRTHFATNATAASTTRTKPLYLLFCPHMRHHHHDTGSVFVHILLTNMRWVHGAKPIQIAAWRHYTYTHTQTLEHIIISCEAKARTDHRKNGVVCVCSCFRMHLALMVCHSDCLCKP